MPDPSLVSLERIERAILTLRGQKVMLDADLAAMYGVETEIQVHAVKRSRERFPSDFMFQLSPDEFERLRVHSGTSSSWGGRRYPPYAVAEQGVAMLSSVLRSARAVQVNIEIMWAFVRLRRMVASNAELARRLHELEKKYDVQFKIVFDAICALMARPERARRRVGFRVEEGRPRYRQRRPRPRRGHCHNPNRTSGHRHAPQSASPVWCPGISGGDPLAVARSVVEIE